MAETVKKNVYNDTSITSLKGADRVRKRPAVIFGSDGLEGCEHSFFEILSNAVDEAREGYGRVIKITVFNDHSIEVDDSGRGVPLGWNEKEKEWNWYLVYCELYAGGKYNNNDANASYEYSLGLNGLGACATQYSSEYMTVASYDGTFVREMSFKKGKPARRQLSERELEKREKRTGTVIRWKPDLEVFTDINIPKAYYEDTLRRQSIVNAGIEFKLLWQDENGKYEESVYLYENGIADYVKDLAGETALVPPVLLPTLVTSGRDREDKSDYKLKADIAFCLSSSVSCLEYYHNSSFLEYGGAPDKAVKSAFVSALDKMLKANDKYNKNESRITFGDIEECLVLVINSFSTQTSYENQTKKAINNTFIQKALTEHLLSQLEIYFRENHRDADMFAKQVLINKRSREEAERSRVDIKKKLSKANDLSNRVEKFVACRTKDPELRELYIVEGDSACTSCRLGRNAEFQAIMPVRGKTLNCLKSTYDKIFKNEIIVDLLRVIGCGVEIRTSKQKDLAAFDFNNFRWSKIILCTDADEDGFQIRTLLLTIFYRLLPTLLEEGKIFIAESPLFEITSKDKTYFAYNEAEKAEILNRIGNAKYTLQRSKGLGENEPDMMWQTTMNPATRRLVAVKMADAAETARMFDVLLGDNIAARKEFIAERGALYAKEADV